MSGTCVTAEHVLDVMSRSGLVSQEVLRYADHSITDQQVCLASLVRRELAKSLSKLQRSPILVAANARRIQAPERPELVLDVLQAFRDRQRVCPGRLALGRVHERLA